MKNKLKNTSIVAAAIIGCALIHVLPAIAIAIIATGGEGADAIGAVVLLCSSLGLGYLHGANRTLDNF